MKTEKTINVGLGITGSFCTHAKLIKELEIMQKLGYNITPVFSENAASIDSRFGKAKDFISKIEKTTGNKGIFTIPDAEPIGPKKMFDILIIAPCSGNTIAKLAHDIIDTPATMATKSHLRNDRPVVIAISTNNALSGAAENIGKLLNRKNYYFVPFKQDNPITKPRSVVFDFDYLIKTIKAALDGKQIQPILL